MDATRWLPELPYEPTMPSVLRRAAAEFGDEDYVVLPDRRISFRELENASRHLAKELLAAGVSKGSHVGIHLPTGPEWAVAFASVTRIGAIAMPFSTLYRPAELQMALRVGDVSLLLSSTHLLGKDHEPFLEEALPGLVTSPAGRLRLPMAPHLRSIRLLGDSARPWAETFRIATARPEEPVDGFDDTMLAALEREVTPADPIVVVFTSGTTAEPKAVVHTHGATLRKTAPQAEAALSCMYRVRSLSLMPFFWIGGIQEVLSALQTGATILTLERLDAAEALALGKREGATSIWGNPQAMRSLFGDTPIEKAIPSLRPLPTRPWEGGPSSRGHMATGIGMTETFGPWTNVKGMECRIVEPNTAREVEEGEIGEFLIRGYGLMHGLYKREREQVFDIDGFYATGDLGYVEDGKYYFASRLKDMIKTKGANVAPPEVESVLNAHPTVRISFVVGIDHDTYGEEVVAGVVPENGETLDVDALMAECRASLSSYKVPRTIMVIPPGDVPYLSSSKPDRRAIKELIAMRRSASGG